MTLKTFIISIFYYPILVFLQSNSIIIFENHKLKLSYNQGKIEEFYKPVSWKKNDVMQIRIFRDNRIYIGKEIKSNQNIEVLKKQYLKKALELENQKSATTYNETDLKITYESKNKIYSFYYYISFLNISKSEKCGFGNGWAWYGKNPFWIEVTSNGILEKWERFDFE